MDPQIHNTGLIEAFMCPRVPVGICFRRGRKHAKHEETCALLASVTSFYVHVILNPFLVCKLEQNIVTHITILCYKIYIYIYICIYTIYTILDK